MRPSRKPLPLLLGSLVLGCTCLAGESQGGPTDSDTGPSPGLDHSSPRALLESLEAARRRGDYDLELEAHDLQSRRFLELFPQDPRIVESVEILGDWAVVQSSSNNAGMFFDKQTLCRRVDSKWFVTTAPESYGEPEVRSLTASAAAGDLSALPIGEEFEIRDGGFLVSIEEPSSLHLELVGADNPTSVFVHAEPLDVGGSFSGPLGGRLHEGDRVLWFADLPIGRYHLRIDYTAWEPSASTVLKATASRHPTSTPPATTLESMTMPTELVSIALEGMETKTTLVFVPESTFAIFQLHLDVDGAGKPPIHFAWDMTDYPNSLTMVHPIAAGYHTLSWTNPNPEPANARFRCVTLEDVIREAGKPNAMGADWLPLEAGQTAGRNFRVDQRGDYRVTATSTDVDVWVESSLRKDGREFPFYLPFVGELEPGEYTVLCGAPAAVEAELSFARIPRLYPGDSAEFDVPADRTVVVDLIVEDDFEVDMDLNVLGTARNGDWGNLEASLEMLKVRDLQHPSTNYEWTSLFDEDKDPYRIRTTRFLRSGKYRMTLTVHGGLTIEDSSFLIRTKASPPKEPVRSPYALSVELDGEAVSLPPELNVVALDVPSRTMALIEGLATARSTWTLYERDLALAQFSGGEAMPTAIVLDRGRYEFWATRAQRESARIGVRTIPNVLFDEAFRVRTATAIGLLDIHESARVEIRLDSPGPANVTLTPIGVDAPWYRVHVGENRSMSITLPAGSYRVDVSSSVGDATLIVGAEFDPSGG